MPVLQLLLDLLLSATTIAFGAGFVLGVLVMWVPKFITKRALRNTVEEAYSMLRNVCEPMTLDPAYPGNREYMMSEARDRVNVLIHKLRSAGFQPPARCDRSEESLRAWFTFLGDVRAELATWF